jgi:hypothetical protein
MRAMRQLAQSADTLPLRLPTESVILDASSTATIVVCDRAPVFNGADWAIHRECLVSATMFADVEVKIDTETVAQKTGETSTASRDVLLKEAVQMIRLDVPGIFIAARPVRKKLFEMQFTIPKDGLPKRKPFVWIPENPDEE